MITNVKNRTLYLNGELSNDDYHSGKYDDYASGSSLYRLFSECPADFRFGDDEEGEPLHFGTSTHAAMLEPELFKQEFVRELAKIDDKNYLTSDKAIKDFIASKGIAGYSNKPYQDLVVRALYIDPKVKIFSLDKLLQQYECSDKTLVKGENFDNIIKMRDQLFNCPENRELFEGATVETSIFCEVQIAGIWYKVKIRPDIITKNGMVPDYKTTARMNPEEFARQAFNAGYWFKQAFVIDVLSAVYGQQFTAALLAQGKKSPFITQLYMLTEEQLQVGREQYIYALEMFGRCKSTNSWPAYFDGPVNLPTPEYIARRYNFS